MPITFLNLLAVRNFCSELLNVQFNVECEASIASICEHVIVQNGLWII